MDITLDDTELALFKKLLYGIAGIHLTPAKKALVQGRLAKRVKHYGLASYRDYHRLITEREDELQVAVDLLTTNETYFFREAKHFEWLRAFAAARRRNGRPLRVWSAASSSGEEAYTIAMVLADTLGDGPMAPPWEVVGTDISTRMLEQARKGLYDQHRARDLPRPYLHKYCLKGVGGQAGKILVDPALRRRVQFSQVNLNEPLPDVGGFDVIFLRNVMIYFQPETKQRVVERLIHCLRPGGGFLVGHSETLSGITRSLTAEAPSIYRKPGGGS